MTSLGCRTKTNMNGDTYVCAINGILTIMPVLGKLQRETGQS